jgi:hypothetical protein
MELGDLLEEAGLGPAHVLERLPGQGLRPEADEVARVPGPQGDPDLAVHLGAADAGAVPRARVDDDEGPLPWILARAGRLPATAGSG